MEELRAAGLKENVNPVGGGLWGPARRETKLGRLGLGLGIGAQEPRSSRERAGVLAPNSTLGNGGGVDSMEWLKDRVAQHKLVSKSHQSELDSGSRHLRKLVSPAVDGNDKRLGALGKPSAGLSSSKEVGRTTAGREQQSFGSHPSPSRSRGSLSHSRTSVDHGGERIAKNHRFSSGVQAVGAKSPWPASNRGVIEIYQDDSIKSQDHHRDSSRMREVSNVRPVEIKSPLAASLLASRSFVIRSETEEQSKVSSLNSPSDVFLSKFQLQQDQVCVKKLSSPQLSSHSMGSGLWSGSKRQGTPYKSTGVLQSRDSVVDRPERSSSRDQQQFSSGGRAAGLNLIKSENGQSSVTSHDRREVSRIKEVKVEGVAEEKLPWNTGSNMDMAAVGHGSARLSSEVTGGSSSGSSSTPCLTGNSSFDGDTVKSREPTPLGDKAVSSSCKLSNVYSKLSRINKRSRSLGPASRVLRDGVESCNSRISPVSVPPIIESDCSAVTTAEEVAKASGGELEHPSSDPRKRKAERDPSGGESVDDGRDLAVDMSHDGLSLDNKENVPIPVVPDLSNCLNSLSLGGEDILKKDDSKLSLSNSNSMSPIPAVAPPSQLTTSKLVENCRAAPSKSHSARPELSGETSSRYRVRISPSDSGNPQSLLRKPARRSPILSENTGGELSNKAVGLPCNTEAKVRVVPSERAQDSEAGALQSSDGTGKENGQEATATSQKKTSENSHFVWVNDKRYQKLGKIGKGGSSEVFKVIDSDCNIYAMKKINLKGREHRAALGFYQEIEYLERLLGKRNVIQLIDYEVTNRTVISEDYEEEKILEDACIYMVLEFGEIDLAGILSKKRKEMMESDEIIDDNWLRFYWKHMLLAVKTIHDERIVHADLKPANFLLVKGELKLIDFGIAKAIQNDTTHIVRDSQVGTLNYMSPEAFMTNSIDEQGRTVKCGRASDIWSLGCILYQMVYGHTPFSQVDSFYAKIQAITSKSHKIPFPAIPDPWLLDVMKKCLTWDRYSRPQITDLLEHPFLRPELANQQKLAV